MQLDGSRFRERRAPVTTGEDQLGIVEVFDPPSGVWTQIGTYSLPAKTFTSSVERTWDQINPGPPFRSGGSFLNVKAELPQNTVRGGGTYFGQVFGWGTIRYTGGFADPWFQDTMSDLDYLSVGDDLSDPALFPSLAAVGSEAFHKMKPRLESAGLSVALAEARDIPRMMRTSAEGFHDIWKTLGGSRTSSLMKPKKLSDHYLNLQFGWTPFVKDLRQFYDVYQNSGKYIAQITRDNNTWVRRRRSMSHIEHEEILWDSQVNGASGFLVAPNDLFIQSLYSSARFQVVLQTMSDVWSVGSFKYYRPEFDASLNSHNSAWDRMNRQLTIYGARINPSVVWQATPWSWLVDWFSAVGDNIKAANDMVQDSVSARYQYVMHHQYRKVVLRQTVGFHNGARILEWRRSYDIKRRDGAESPYGFNLSWGNLSPRQLSILAAIGVSRRVPRGRN